MKHDLFYLRHILDAILRIESYLAGVDRAAFSGINLVQDGVIRQLEIIGEAGKRISSEMKAKYDKVPWADVVGMRNKLIHDYFGVDLDTVWLTAKEDIPFLKGQIEAMIEEVSPSE